MSQQDKINTALMMHKPNNAEIAFYRGVGFKDLSKHYPEFTGPAIDAFKDCIRLDSSKSYTMRAHTQIQNLERLIKP